MANPTERRLLREKAERRSARPRCFHCGKRLVVMRGKPIFATYVDPIGVEHKMHRACAALPEYQKPVTAQERDRAPRAAT